ncbi:DUF1800 domain-containing protein [Pedobacter nyackensis]|uniref:Uncharacterized conserved protein, DUF1800 family n=1 Tax=Pedobacter nyackensis TaxID=475255 RepID=A0A1W2BD22_9SPHI|nr:DUF1800 domain-containing protein [Pedobacter nyackensis]SMC70670.1 Uncharacterized conserved protein, DUF1800 family [Pedobacter nyackensis]
MKTPAKVIYSFVFVLLVTVLCSAFQKEKPAAVKFSFPYKKAGLDERQAAAHLLSRFTYGAKPEDIDAVVKIGLEKWFVQQLDGKIEDEALNKSLSQYDDINLSNAEVEDKYPRPGQALRMAVKEGVINKDSVNKGDGKEYRQQIKAFMDSKGYKPQQELFRQFFNQKILRATYTNNQLNELLTDFWFNHFNVSLTKNQSAPFTPAYERDVIRPNVTGKFQTLLMATAKSPAMLMYLDNFSSSGQPVANNDDMQMQMGEKKTLKKRPGFRATAIANSPALKKLQEKKKQGGLNENYAREVMELHTLGVDGGYTQSDVTQAARVLTGWTIAPMGENGYGFAAKNLLEKTDKNTLEKRGFVHDGDFLFMPTRHDNGERIVLGKHFPANGGYEEGVELLTMLAHHPSTAKFISKKLATRFVNDNPASSLVDKMAKTFTKTDGDIKQMMITMATAPEFWSKESLREKTKSPFELAISAVRSLNAEITQPYQLYNWINKMGQKMYYYQAPTGFPDKGQYWINTGSLLNRMNFGLALATQRIPGIKINLASLNNNHEPESADAALLIYCKLIMPERDVLETVKRLKPMLNDPNLVSKVESAAAKTGPPQTMDTMENEEMVMKTNKKGIEKPVKKNSGKNATAVTLSGGNNTMLAQVVGVIIGSPEFQRK